LILDEAHEVEDTAGTYFGVSISSYQVQDLRRDVLGVLRRKQINADEIERVLIRFGDAAEMFFALFPATDGRTGFVGQGSFLERHGHSYREVLAGLELIWTHLELIKAAPEETLPLLRRAREMHQDLTMWMEGGDPAFVYWIERRGRGCYLQATPIDVSSLLAHKLFDKIKSVVLTSATLTVAGSFDFVQQRLGVPEARTLLVSSPYDYGEQALLYVPQHLPDPRDAAFPYASWQEILRILRASQGRAFVLFTSVQAMRNAYDRISEQIEYPTLMQGTGPRHALLEEFRSTPNAILFATSSFWQGVDVPGDQLSCVIIDKLPFAVPSDPVVQARIRMVREAGGEPFREYQIPQAAIALKQGFGRLIRGRSDRGVLVLLDNRITRQRYGQIFFDSLPDYGFTVDWNDVEKFFLCMK
jgi:ATP-dependent DNA helicase DinG